VTDGSGDVDGVGANKVVDVRSWGKLGTCFSDNDDDGVLQSS